MRIVLLRHAIAEDRMDFFTGNRGVPDSERPLTEDGIDKMKLGARGLVAALDGDIQRVITSPFVRAKHTAELLIEAIPKNPPKLEVEGRLAIGCDATERLKWLGDETGTVVLIGHEPDMSTLMERFCGGTGYLHLKFGKGAACMIDFPNGVGESYGLLRWFVSPRLLRTLGSK